VTALKGPCPGPARRWGLEGAEHSRKRGGSKRGRRGGNAGFAGGRGAVMVGGLEPVDETVGTADGPGAATGLADAGFRRLLGVFLVSGAAGLVDQVCFSKYLSYVVGATAYAVSAVLAAFMTGLALGATVGGRLSTRIRRPLLAYGAAELVVAAAVVFAPA